MELRQYWRIVGRRWWLVLALVVTVLGVSLLLGPLGRTRYVASMRMVLSVPPQRIVGDTLNYDPTYYSFLNTEYLADDFSEILKSAAFAEDIGDELGDASLDWRVMASRRTTKTHRILSLKLTAADKEQAQHIGEAAARVIERKGKEYLAQLRQEDVQVRVIDPPEVTPEMGLLRVALEVGLRSLLGLVAGVAVAFVLHYLDSTMYEAEEAERLLGLRVLGEIPPEA